MDWEKTTSRRGRQGEYSLVSDDNLGAIAALASGLTGADRNRAAAGHGGVLHLGDPLAVIAALEGSTTRTP